MFDKTYISRTESPSHITVHEHLAPTAESVRLVNEYNEKFLKNIIDRIKVEDNLLKGEIIIYREFIALCDTRVILKFSLNGKDFSFDEQLDTTVPVDQKIEAFRKLFRKFSETITESLLVESKDIKRLLCAK